MAYGAPSKSVRRGSVHSERPNTIARGMVTPTTTADGQSRDGTPAGRQSTRASSQSYADGAAHRAAEGSQPYPGMNPYGSKNPQVHSKAATFHGRPHTPGRV